MKRISFVLALGVALTLANEASACPGGIDGTFIQLQDAQLRWGRQEWARTLDQLRELGVSTIVVQYTGDDRGAFEGRYGVRTLAHLLLAAERRRMSVWLGLDYAPRWPRVAPARFSPLADRERTARLAGLCAFRRSCVGFYLSPEIDDATWSDRVGPLRARLARAARILHRRAPRARVSIAPFFTRTLSPAAYAAFMRALVDGTGVDVVMLQGGTGTGRASADDARRYLRALVPRLREIGVETWLVVELFEQRAGTPWDEGPFEARPGAIARVRRALLSNEPALEHRVAFSVLDYMSGSDARAARLRADYVALCRRRTPRVAERAPPR